MRKLVSFVVFLLSPLTTTLACTVCFGSADSNLIKGFTWGILLLLFLPFSLMAGITGLIVYTIKKNKARG